MTSLPLLLAELPLPGWLLAVLGGGASFFLLLGWWLLSPGSRRRRGLARIQHRLQKHSWRDALNQAQQLRDSFGSLSGSFRDQLDHLEAQAFRLAMQEALEARRYEQGLEFGLKAARLVMDPDIAIRTQVQNAMLEEVRERFSRNEIREVHELVGRILQVQTPCREASFWLALTYLREGQEEVAVRALETARGTEAVSAFIDPPLYLGSILLRGGQAKESLKFLTEANRVDGKCPVVTVLLGSAIIAAGGDAGFAARTLQRALGPKGLALWESHPQRAWVEAFPEHHSYIRKLAVRHPFACPLWGPDLKLLQRQGNLALAQAEYRLERYPESARIFDHLLKEGAPSLPVLRGLGLALARQGKFDDAFKHLRAAHEMEQPQDRLTAGYLALCGAKGKPPRAEDRQQNILWAIRLVQQFNAPGDREWVNLLNALYAEARTYQTPLSADDQIYLCEHLWSVQADDSLAAQAYHQLQSTFPAVLRPEYAWLYCRAVEQGHIQADLLALDLFAITFRDPAPARTFFEEKNWNFQALELAYLALAAEHAPGRFPEPLGPEYPPRGEHLLLETARALEEEQRFQQSLEYLHILAQLAPNQARVLDRLAQAKHRQGEDPAAMEYLEQWSRFHPTDPVPLVRWGVLLARNEKLTEGFDKLRQALYHTQGKRRAEIAVLAARLVLQRSENWRDPAVLHDAREFLDLAVQSDPLRPEANWLMAGLDWVRGEFSSLAQRAASMQQETEQDPRYHFFAGLCRLLNHDFAGALASCDRVRELAAPVGLADEHPRRNGTPAGPVDLELEVDYLRGLALEGLNRREEALRAIESPARSGLSPTSRIAQALAGIWSFLERRHGEAVRWWQQVDPKKRAEWNLIEPLANATFLTALEAFQAGNFEESAELLRAAGKAGCRDRRLGLILRAALFQAGQKAYFDTGDPA